MKLKYKVKDAATDFGVKAKDITEVLEKYTGVSKKTMTALEDTDMNILFEHFTKTNAEHVAIIEKLKNEGLWYVYE